MATAVQETPTVSPVAGTSTMVEEEPSWWWEYAAMKAPDHNELYYVKYTFMSIAYFCTVLLVTHWLCMRYIPLFRELDDKKRIEYRSHIVGMTHAVVAVLLSTISMWYICPGDQTVFNSDECMNTPRYIHVWALLHSCGYFIVDFFFIFFVMQGNTTLDYQTYAHHIVATTTFYQTLYFMDFMIVFGVMLLFTEISTPFLSGRWLFFTHNNTQSKWYQANILCLFLSFLGGRVIYQFYIVLFYGADWVYAEYMKRNLTVYQGLVVTEMAVMVILSIALNSYWLWLMIKMIIRVVKRALSPPEEDIEKVELVKADGLAIDNEADCGSSTQGSAANSEQIAEEGQDDKEVHGQNIGAIGNDV